MTNVEFLQIQRELNINSIQLATLLGVTSDTVYKWRIGRKITGPAAVAMRLLRKYPNELKEVKA